MPHRGIRIAQWVAMLFSALAAFWYIAALDQLGVLGASHVVLVSDSDRRSSSEAVVAAITEVAEGHRATIAWWTPDLREPDRVRHLYLAVGDPASPTAHWRRDGYPWFSRETETRLHTLDEASRMDPQGHYVVFGDAATTADLVRRMSELGFQTQAREYYTPRSILGWAANNPTTMLLSVVGGFVVALVGADVLTRTRAYGVQRLQGATWRDMLWRDVASVAASGLIAAVAVAVAGVLYLAWYNGLHQVAWVGGLAGAFVLAFTGIGLAAHGAALLLTSRVRLLEALKGRMPAGGMMVSAFAIRLGATMMALTMVTSTVASMAALRRAELENSVWVRAADAAFVQFNGDLAEAETAGLVMRAGGWLKREIRDGHAILAQKDIFNGGGIAPPTGAPRMASLLVDQHYLDRNPAAGADGSQVSSLSGVVQVLVPTERVADLPGIKSLVEQWTAQAAQRTGSAVPSVQASLLRRDQRLFTYGATNSRTVEAFFDDPLLIVADQRLSILAEDDAMAFASQGGVVLLDQQQAIASSDAAGLRTFVVAFSAVALKAQARASELARGLQIQTFGLLGALALLMASGWGLAELHVRRSAQALFARFVHGWSFWRSHRLALCLELVVAVVIVGATTLSSVLALSEASQSAFLDPELQSRLPLGGLESLAALGVAGLSAGAFLVSAARLTRQLVRHHASEA